MRRLLLSLAILAVLAVPAFANAPAGGHYSGRGSIFTGQGAAKSPLPVSFTLHGRRIGSLTLGPAKVACDGDGGQSVITFPKLTGFPAEPLTDGSDNEYDYYFKQVNGHFRSIGNQVARRVPTCTRRSTPGSRPTGASSRTEASTYSSTPTLTARPILQARWPQRFVGRDVRKAGLAVPGSAGPRLANQAGDSPSLCR